MRNRPSPAATSMLPIWVYALLGASLLLNVFLLLTRGEGLPPSEPGPGLATLPLAQVSQPAATAAPDGTAAPAAPAAPAAAPAASATPAVAGDAPAAMGTAPAAAPAPEVTTGNASAGTSAAPGDQAMAGADDTGWQIFRGSVEHSLARTFQDSAGEDSAALSGVYSRLFMWDLDMRRDLQAGDAVAVVWRKGADGVPVVAAASLVSGKLGRTLTAYRWQLPGDRYTSYWDSEGREATRRLVNGPLNEYEQITSLLKDRPTHKGMDFKTPVGTEVVSPKAGSVLRSNWNWKANGNCIEVRFDDGVLAKFLHLSENLVGPGQRVAAGQAIARTGNTGRCTAPHLHYQLDRDTRTIDPVDYHGIEQRRLEPAQVEALRRDTAGFARRLEESARP